MTKKAIIFFSIFLFGLSASVTAKENNNAFMIYGTINSDVPILGEPQFTVSYNTSPSDPKSNPECFENDDGDMIERYRYVNFPILVSSSSHYKVEIPKTYKTDDQLKNCQFTWEAVSLNFKGARHQEYNAYFMKSNEWNKKYLKWNERNSVQCGYAPAFEEVQPFGVCVDQESTSDFFNFVLPQKSAIKIDIQMLGEFSLPLERPVRKTIQLPGGETISLFEDYAKRPNKIFGFKVSKDIKIGDLVLPKGLYYKRVWGSGYFSKDQGGHFTEFGYIAKYHYNGNGDLIGWDTMDHRIFFDLPISSLNDFDCDYKLDKNFDSVIQIRYKEAGKGHDEVPFINYCFKNQKL